MIGVAEQEIRELLGLLRDELELHKVLLDLSKRKQRVLLDGSLEELVRITETEQALILQVALLNGKLERLHQSLGEEFGTSTGELTLSRLVELVGEPQASELARLRASILGVTQEMNQVNQINGALIRHILAYINLSLTALADAWAGDGTYRPAGGGLSGGGRPGAVLVDRKA